MNSSHQIHPPQIIGQPAFFYYKPELRTEHRSGHFSPHPNGLPENMQVPFQRQDYRHEIMSEQPQMAYHRPSISGPHVYLQTQPQHTMQPVITPLVSPQPVHQKPSFLYQNNSQQLSLNTDCNAADLCIYPSTPPLSVSDSAASSPPSTCGILATPMSGPFFALENIEGVKEGCEGEVKSEILAGEDWTRSCSPPLTPGEWIRRNPFVPA